jgi:hypothetical protein
LNTNQLGRNSGTLCASFLFIRLTLNPSEEDHVMALIRNDLDDVPSSYSWNLTAICLLILTVAACVSLWISPIQIHTQSGSLRDYYYYSPPIEDNVAP